MNEPSQSPAVKLSAAGRARRHAMRGELCAALGRIQRTRRRRAQIRRAALIAAPLVLVVLIAREVGKPGASENGDGSGRVAIKDGSRDASQAAKAELRPAPPPPPPHAVDHQATVVNLIETEAGISDRLAVRAAAPASIIIDDEALVATLARLDERAGLIRAGGRAWLSAPIENHASSASGGS